jgi:hypothetical protein
MAVNTDHLLHRRWWARTIRPWWTSFTHNTILGRGVRVLGTEMELVLERGRVVGVVPSFSLGVSYLAYFSWQVVCYRYSSLPLSSMYTSCDNDLDYRFDATEDLASAFLHRRVCLARLSFRSHTLFAVLQPSFGHFNTPSSSWPAVVAESLTLWTVLSWRLRSACRLKDLSHISHLKRRMCLRFSCSLR